MPGIQASVYYKELQTNNAAEADADKDGAVTYTLVATSPIPGLLEGR